MRANVTPHRTHGFTLVEVMVSLVIMGFIMISITAILSTTRKDRDHIHSIQEQQLAGPAILNRLEADLRALAVYNVEPARLLRVKDRSESGFDADSLDFLCTVDSLLPYRENTGEPFRRADVNEVGYRLRANPQHDDFLELYRREDFGIDEEPFDGGRYALMHDRVKSFNIEIYEEDGPDAEPLDSWGSAGEETSGVPFRLSIELIIEVAPRLTREALVPIHSEVTYRRVIRFSPGVHLAQNLGIVPTIPRIDPPVADTGAGGAAGAGGAGGAAGQGGAGGGQGGAGGPRGGANTGGGGGNGFDALDTSGDSGGNPFGGG